MKIAVDMGHCPKSTGTVGYLNEMAEDRRIGAALIAELKARGHGVVDVTPGDGEAESLSGRARRANAAGCGFFVSIHLNAGGGTGTEVYTTSGSGAKAQAAAVSAAVASVLGLKNRGHKTANFTVLVKTSMPAILVETCFVDTSLDAEAYRACTPEKIAGAIADGILGEAKGATSSGSASPAPAPSAPSPSKAGLSVDGLWGKETTRALQRALGTGADGIVSEQYAVYRSANPGLLASSWSWRTAPEAGGSPMVKALQRKLGVAVDGYVGPSTIAALQRRLGTGADGRVSKPSPMVKELQRRLNAGTF